MKLEQICRNFSCCLFTPLTSVVIFIAFKMHHLRFLFYKIIFSPDLPRAIVHFYKHYMSRVAKDISDYSLNKQYSQVIYTENSVCCILKGKNC